jgi:DNA-binding NarL/FixJ family response regulator
MGLSIVKKIIDDLNGDISVRSNLNDWTDFSVKLKTIQPSELSVKLEQDISLDEWTLETGESESFELVPEDYKQDKPVLFIVEDNKALLSYLQKKLSDEYNVLYALNGEQALEKIQRIPKPHVIISDIMMDQMDGFTFYDELVKNNICQSVPFIFLTALNTSNDTLNGLSKGAVDYISKPFQISVLKEKIRSHIRIQNALEKENLASLAQRLMKHLDNQELAHPSNQIKIESPVLPEDEPDLNLSDDYNSDTHDDDFLTLHRRYQISQRQVEIVALMKNGLERKEICDRLGMSLNTLKTQIRRMFIKCKVTNKTELLNLFY